MEAKGKAEEDFYLEVYMCDPMYAAKLAGDQEMELSIFESIVTKRYYLLCELTAYHCGRTEAQLKQMKRIRAWLNKAKFPDIQKPNERLNDAVSFYGLIGILTFPDRLEWLIRAEKILLHLRLTMWPEQRVLLARRFNCDTNIEMMLSIFERHMRNLQLVNDLPLFQAEVIKRIRPIQALLQPGQLVYLCVYGTDELKNNSQLIPIVVPACIVKIYEMIYSKQPIDENKLSSAKIALVDFLVGIGVPHCSLVSIPSLGLSLQTIDTLHRGKLLCETFMDMKLCPFSDIEELPFSFEDPHRSNRLRCKKAAETISPYCVKYFSTEDFSSPIELATCMSITRAVKSEKVDQ